MGISQAVSVALCHSCEALKRELRANPLIKLREFITPQVRHPERCEGSQTAWN